MHNTKLLASVALFTGLIESGKDIYDVIAALIMAAIRSESKWSFNALEATQLLDRVFGFQIPDAVVETTLRNRLKRDEQYLTFENGLYSVSNHDTAEQGLLSADILAAQTRQRELFSELVTYVSKNVGRAITPEFESTILSSLARFLVDDERPIEFSKQISAFVIESSLNHDKTKTLNAIREGFVLYDGIRYSRDLGQLGSWRTKLTVYLDTEHLFDAAGFNGTLFKRLFDDFFKLVSDVNSSGSKKIKLKYFEENESEIDSFFYVAELVLEGKRPLNPSKTAMVEILNGCSAKADIIEKKARLKSVWRKLGISKEQREDFYQDENLVVEGESIVDQLSKQAEEGGYEFNSEKCQLTLALFTKINVLRNGNSAKRFEDIGHILLSATRSTQVLAFNPLVKGGKNDIPFATDIKFLTNRLWFNLQKGLGPHAFTPASLDAVIKAQIVLSSQINYSIAEKFDEMRDRLTKGDISLDEAQYLNSELRSRTARPEQIVPELLPEQLQFLTTEDVEVHLQERSILEERAAQGEDAIRQLESIRENSRLAAAKRRARKASYFKVCAWFSVFLILVLIATTIGVSINSLRTPADTPLAWGSLIISTILGFLQIVKWKKIRRYIDNKCEKIMNAKGDDGIE